MAGPKDVNVDVEQPQIEMKSKPRTPKERERKKNTYRLTIKKSRHKDTSKYTNTMVKVAAKIFKDFDKNRNGRISKGEFKSALVKIRAATESTSDLHAKIAMDKMHEAGHKHIAESVDEIDFDEFLAAMADTQRNAEGAEGGLYDVFKRAMWYIDAQEFMIKYYGPGSRRPKYTRNYGCCPPPILILCVSILMVGTFIHYVEVDNRCGGEGLTNSNLECPEIFDSIWAYHYNSAYEGQIWRFFTYMFLHGGWAHILGNVFLQMIIGIPLEMVHGPWRVGALYFLGGLAGSCAVSMFDVKTNLVGASGAVYSLMGAHVATIINYFNIMPYALPRIVFFGLIFCLDTGYSIYSKYQLGNTEVSYTAHLSGSLLGLIFGGVILDELKTGNGPEAAKYSRWKHRMATLIVIGGFLATIIFNIIAPQK